MAIQNTGIGKYPYPDNQEFLKYVWQYIRDLAQAVEKDTVQRYLSASDRSARCPSPLPGQMGYVVDQNIVCVYAKDAAGAWGWQQVWPNKPGVYSGTAAPAAGLGSVGDIYFQS